jgi:hypothetical protein
LATVAGEDSLFIENILPFYTTIGTVSVWRKMFFAVILYAFAEQLALAACQISEAAQKLNTARPEPFQGFKL